MLRDLLADLFSDEVIGRLRKAPQTNSLEYRVLVITLERPFQVPWIPAQRAAWMAYLDAAAACGLFADPHAKDLVTRLTSADDEQFRSAMAECQAAWYLTEKLGLDATARPPGKGARKLELLLKLPDGDVHVEVKSPLRVPIGDGIVRELDDSDIIERCLADASKQFAEGRRNLLMLVGRLTVGAHGRRFFIDALFARRRWVIHKDTVAGTVGPVETEFRPSGRFLKEWRAGEGPRHTRISGVLYVEEQLRPRDDDGVASYRAEPDVLMLHNPFATHPVPEEPWGACPQLVLRGDVMQWTDGESV
jgi:hypothetical protein